MIVGEQAQRHGGRVVLVQPHDAVPVSGREHASDGIDGGWWRAARIQ